MFINKLYRNRLVGLLDLMKYSHSEATSCSPASPLLRWLPRFTCKRSVVTRCFWKLWYSDPFRPEAPFTPPPSPSAYSLGEGCSVSGKGCEGKSS